MGFRLKSMATATVYPEEILDEDLDDGTMPANVERLADAVVGHRIVCTAWERGRMVIVLDNDRAVVLRDTDDCCAYTALAAFLLHPDRVDHVILGVGTTDDFQTWHIYADLGDVLELTVGWSCGNPFYYGYGFDIQVRDLS